MNKSVIITLNLGYWGLYLTLLLFMTLLTWTAESDHGLQPNIKVNDFFNLFILLAIPSVIGFYSFYITLFSKYLKHKKFILLLLAGIVASIIAAIIGLLIESAPCFFGTKLLFSNGYKTAFIFVLTSVVALINGIIGLVIKGFITWYGDIKLKEELNKKNFEMELMLFKSQISPHFLFNTINNIDVLIEKDALKASIYLNKLSDIMRFMLYETTTEEIELTKELAYIEKYVDLQKIRTSNSNYVNYAVTGSSVNLKIPPMLFIPFIENAFKHAENKKTGNAINIKVVIEKNKILFDCENSYSEVVQTKPEQSGLGNDLIKKRLMLLYPNKHTLAITKENKIYKVTLTLYVTAN